MTVDEILVGVAIALGNRSVSECNGFDQTVDQEVTVDELVAAVRDALNGCEASFVDVAEKSGIDHRHLLDVSAARLEIGVPVTGGVAVADFNGDGHADLLFTNSGGPPFVYRNTGGGRFALVTEELGFDAILAGSRSNGAGWADLDNDGDQDLLLTTYGIDQDRYYYYFVNAGEDGFREQAAERGFALEGPGGHFGMSVAFGDYNNDGWLDVFVGEWRFRVDEAGVGTVSYARLLRNRGATAPGYFDDVTAEAGLVYEETEVGQAGILGTFSFTPTFADMDGDGWQDLLITADFGSSRLFWNRGDGTFSDGTAAAGVGGDENGMGAAIGDYDGDGLLDWFITSIFDPADLCGPDNEIGCTWGWTGNRLYRNSGGRTFVDRTDDAGVRDGFWGWGTAFFDWDNDADLDLIAANGFRTVVPHEQDIVERFLDDPIRLWRNGGGRFQEVSDQTNLRSTASGKGIAIFDHDEDGDLDVVVANSGEAAHFFRNNDGSSNDWLRVKVIGRDSNRDGIGARVRVTRTSSDTPQVREIIGGSNYLGQNELVAHFGLGTRSAAVAEVRVFWPATRREVVLRDVASRQLIVVEEPA